MPTDHFRYDLLAQQALRGVVQRVLADAAKNGLPGEHHFYISFDTRAPGVRISQRLREKYPEEMTIVLQHQFWDLIVTDDAFEVGLSFGGVPERLGVPLEAIRGFFDPSVQFALQFEAGGDTGETSSDQLAVPASGAREPAAKRRRTPRTKGGKAPAPTAPAPTTPAVPAPSELFGEGVEPRDKPDRPTGGGEVVRLDRFRKK
jgi:hypothetical protein